MKEVNQEFINHFASLTLKNILREYPNRITHNLASKEDAKEPHELHPIFYGCYDWHSCVHGYWLLVRLLRLFDVPNEKEIRRTLSTQLSKSKVKGEMEYLTNPLHKGFERPYGWAWFLALCAELELLKNEGKGGGELGDNLAPMREFFTLEFINYLKVATYPIRVGTHFNTSFALSLALWYAKVFSLVDFSRALSLKAREWHLKDTDMQVLEPSGDDFLSPSLMQAVLMSKVLGKEEFREYFATYLPKFFSKCPATLFSPAFVSDRSDGKIAHLDGLNLSRAWCFNELELHFIGDEKQLLKDMKQLHLNSALGHISTDYMGEHWLASFALLGFTRFEV